MSESLEAVGKKWAAFVCPDCRCVFRVTTDHADEEVVCPSCRNSLRLPGPGDDAGPLQNHVKSYALVDGVKVKRRHASTRKETAEESWEKVDDERGRENVDGKRAWLALGGGALLLASLVITLMFLLGPDRQESWQNEMAGFSLPEESAAPEAKPAKTDQVGAPVADHEDQLVVDAPAFVKQAEPVVKTFLAAKNVEELLAVSRPRPGLREKIELWYRNEWADSIDAFSIDSMSGLANGPYVLIGLKTSEGEKPMYLEKTGNGAKVDWESWVAWSGMPWEDFLKKRPTDPVEFRVLLRPTSYYNYQFSDDEKWISFSIDSPSKDEWIYGYVPVESELADSLKKISSNTPRPCTLMLKFPPDDSSGKQVIIESLVSETWMVADDKKKP